VLTAPPTEAFRAARSLYTLRRKRVNGEVRVMRVHSFAPRW
jgi:hypothetical protein